MINTQIVRYINRYINKPLCYNHYYYSSSVIKQYSTVNVNNIANLDINRESRCGFPEVIFSSGKSNDHLLSILIKLYELQPTNCIATRVSNEQIEYIKNNSDLLNHFIFNQEARLLYSTLMINNKSTIPGKVSILCAGTSDINIAEEAACLLELSGIDKVIRVYDVGVAGIHRLFNNISLFQDSEVVIVCAGMDGALPSVVGGLVQAPVIAVPTSIGYGASFSGVSALLTMLNSCSPGVTVVNIDNGFGAAVTAYKIINKINRNHNKDKTE